MKRLNYSDSLWDILVDINDKIASVMMDTENVTVPKGFAEYVDVSEHDYSFNVIIDGIKTHLKVGTYIRTAYPDKFSKQEIGSFINKYNVLKDGELPEDSSAIKLVEVPPFKFNPKDLRSTFISLVTKTYPHGHEEEVVPLISPIGLQKDKWENYYKIVGKSETMFTSHLDTADRQQSDVVLYSDIKGTDEILRSDGKTILGADCKSGVAIMLYMISHNIPGIYYFFIGEERGGIGSRDVSNNFESVVHLKGVKRCVSFDRRNYNSVITSQFGEVCCSDTFGKALAGELNRSGLKMTLDPTGIFTDSASFMDIIPECTNISVGYFEEHTRNEHQNMTFLQKLADACLNVKWETLPTDRKVGIDEDVQKVFGKFLSDVKESIIYCSTRVVKERKESYLKFDIDGANFEYVKSDIYSLSHLMGRNKLNNLSIHIDDYSLFIELSDDDMKYKKYLKYFESYDDFDGYDYTGDEDYTDNTDNSNDGEEVPDDTVGELCYWLRKMYKSNDLDAIVESDTGMDVTAYVVMKKRLKIMDIVTAFEVTEKIKKDLLTNHVVEVELYEDKSGSSVFQFDFIQDEFEEPF